MQETMQENHVRFSKILFCYAGFLCLTVLIMVNSPIQAQTVPDDTVLSIAWSHDGQQVATGQADGTIKIWNADTQTEFKTLLGHQQIITGLDWSPDDQKIASASYDATSQVWDVSTGSSLHTFAHKDVVTDIMWTQDGRHLLTSIPFGPETLHLWDAETGKLLKTLGLGGSVADMTWNPNGDLLAVANAGGWMQIVEFSSFSLVSNFDENKISAVTVAWSPDATYIVGANALGEVKIFEAKTQTVIDSFKGTELPETFPLSGSIIALNFENETTLRTVTANGSIQRWDILEGNLLQKAELGGFHAAAAWSPSLDQLAYGFLEIDEEGNFVQSSAPDELGMTIPFPALEKNPN